MDDKILYLPGESVIRACREIDPVAIIRNAFKLHATSQIDLPDEAALYWCNSDGETVRSLNMPCYIAGEKGLAGTKIINGNVANVHRGLNRASGVTLLFNTGTGRIDCILEGAYISSLRTACVTVIAADLFKIKPISHVAIIGCGVLAKMHAQLLLEVFPTIRQIRLFDIDFSRAEKLRVDILSMNQSMTAAIYCTETARLAIENADLVIPLTTTTQGYILFEWLCPGSVLVNVSLDDPMPEVFLRTTLLVVDDWKLVSAGKRRILGKMHHFGQIVGPNESLSIGNRRVDGEIGEFLIGKRQYLRSGADTVLVNPFGLAFEDISLAANIYWVAMQYGLGQTLDR